MRPSSAVSSDSSDSPVSAVSGTESDRSTAAASADTLDLVFAVVNLARLCGELGMPALARANAGFSARFAALEEPAGARGVQLGTATLEELDVLWDEVKRR